MNPTITPDTDDKPEDKALSDLAALRDTITPQDIFSHEEAWAE